MSPQSGNFRLHPKKFRQILSNNPAMNLLGNFGVINVSCVVAILQHIDPVAFIA